MTLSACWVEYRGTHRPERDGTGRVAGGGTQRASNRHAAQTKRSKSTTAFGVQNSEQIQQDNKRRDLSEPVMTMAGLPCQDHI